MADFILIEPSCDIHLALDGLPAVKRDLAFRIFSGTADPVTKRNVIADIAPAELQFDFFPLDQTVLRFTAATHTLTPLAPGTAYMQVRFLDPALPTQYHYLTVRIVVHRKMNGWWFGNKTLSIFRDPDLAHGQASIYALFDRDQPAGGEVGDITGHGYVDLSIDKPVTCSFDIDNLPSGKFRDRLRGMAVGGAVLKGELLGQNRQININVVSLGNLPADPLKPVLQREAFFDGTVPASQRHNILFLGEGFAANNDDGNLFREMVTKASHKLFESNRHAPYSLLKDGFNTWSHLEASPESGVTCGPPLNANGLTIPPAAVVRPSSGKGYELKDLIQTVGLPTQADANTAVADLKKAWNTPGSIPLMLGFIVDAVADNVAEAWKTMIPRGIPQAFDSFYGMMRGRRWGERDSVLAGRAEMISTPAAGAPDFNARRAALGARVFEWYRPNPFADAIVIDPRRYAPEFRPINKNQQGLTLLIDYIAKLADPKVPAANPEHNVGKWWDLLTLIDPAAQARQITSAGLVCMFTNSEHKGGMATPLAIVRVATGRQKTYTFDIDNSVPDIRPLNLKPKIKPDFSIVVDILAHEFGHSFNLGDEYEREKREGTAAAESFDNLTFVGTIQVPPPVAGHDPTFPTPINPDLIKWALVHRIALSNMLVQRSTIQGDKIIATLGAATTNNEKARWALIKEKWRATKEGNVKVFLRRYKPTPKQNQQLPVVAAELYTLTIESINEDGTFTLVGQPQPLEQFPAGSVLYVPKRDVASDPLNLVESAVQTYMKTHRWKSGDNGFPLGVALSENFNKNDNLFRSDEPSDDKDTPPDIPNFDKPCNEYKVIGLYEGGGVSTVKVYRPAGACKMRNQEASDGEGEFCFVCKYLIVNRVDPTKHAELDAKFYPKKKSLPPIFGALPISLSDIK